MQEPSQASALGCSQDVFKGWMTSCRADVHPWQWLSHTVVYRFVFSALAKKDAHFLHTVWWRKDWTWVWWYFLTQHQQTPPVRNRVLYWQFSNAPTPSPGWLTLNPGNKAVVTITGWVRHHIQKAFGGVQKQISGESWKGTKKSSLCCSSHSPAGCKHQFSHSLKGKKKRLIFANI